MLLWSEWCSYNCNFPFPIQYIWHLYISTLSYCNSNILYPFHFHSFYHVHVILFVALCKFYRVSSLRSRLFLSKAKAMLDHLFWSKWSILLFALSYHSLQRNFRFCVFFHKFSNKKKTSSSLNLLAV